MKLLFTTDLHGHRPFYEALRVMALDFGPDYLILGGDLFPRGHDAADTLEVQKRFVTSCFFPWIDSLRGTRVLFIPGNDDCAAAVDLLSQRTGGVSRLDLQGLRLSEDLMIFGYPYVPPTPFSNKDFERCDRKDDGRLGRVGRGFVTQGGRLLWIDPESYLRSLPTIAEELQVIATFPNASVILVAHTPPHGTPLDRLSTGQSVGSVALKEWILRRQPLLTLHGHIHESPSVTQTYWTRLGRTLAVNPGQGGETLSAVRITVTPDYLQLVHAYGPEVAIPRPANEGMG